MDTPESQPNPRFQQFRRIPPIWLAIVALAIVIPVGIVIYRSLPPQSLEARFEETWHDDLNENITLPLLVNRITGCMWIRYKVALRPEDGYFVQCSEDGWQTWKNYQVLPDGKTVISVEE